MGQLLHFKDWHRERWWVSFHEAAPRPGSPPKIIAIETWQWYKTPKGTVLDLQNPPKADKLEITGMVRLSNGTECGFDKLRVDLMAELTEKLAWIGKECASRGIPVVRRK